MRVLWELTRFQNESTIGRYGRCACKWYYRMNRKIFAIYFSGSGKGSCQCFSVCCSYILPTVRIHYRGKYTRSRHIFATHRLNESQKDISIQCDSMHERENFLRRSESISKICGKNIKVQSNMWWKCDCLVVASIMQREHLAIFSLWLTDVRYFSYMKDVEEIKYDRIDFCVPPIKVPPSAPVPSVLLSSTYRSYADRMHHAMFRFQFSHVFFVKFNYAKGNGSKYAAKRK